MSAMGKGDPWIIERMTREFLERLLDMIEREAERRIAAVLTTMRRRPRR